jgi:hypothetical protein
LNTDQLGVVGDVDVGDAVGEAADLEPDVLALELAVADRRELQGHARQGLLDLGPRLDLGDGVGVQLLRQVLAGDRGVRGDHLDLIEREHLAEQHVGHPERPGQEERRTRRCR